MNDENEIFFICCKDICKKIMYIYRENSITS